MKRAVAVFFLLAGSLWAASLARAELPPLIPREVFFGNADRGNPEISPDGRKLAYIAAERGVLNVWVRTVGLQNDRAVTKDRKRGIWYYTWAQNSRHILYVRDKNGDENWHLWVLDTETGEHRDLTPFPNVQARPEPVSRGRPNHVLVSINDRDPQLHDVYLADLRTGELTLVAKNDRGFVGWLADEQLNVRAALSMTSDGGAVLHVRDEPDAKWRKLTGWDAEDLLTSGPVAFTPDGRGLYVISSTGSNTGELREIDLATGREKTLASDQRADAAETLVHPNTGEVQAVSFRRERMVWKVLDPSIEDDIARIRKLHRGDFYVITRDRSDAKWLVSFEADDGPVQYYVYDRNEKTGELLFTNRKALEDVTLARMEPIRFEARDGLTIHGYLTTPPGLAPKNLPMVLKVHGGPWARDVWGYNGTVQWLANRGYAVLQINFRGSTGYGKKFLNAGNREWGGKIHDDLIDGVNWAIEKGIADPKRIGIFGSSFGGYATLVGLTFTPDVFACGVDIVGQSNLITYMETIPPYWKPLEPVLWARVGHPVKDAEFLRSRSPLFKVDQITKPLLIAQGANDPRVRTAETRQLVDALERAGKVVEYVEYPDEGHGFARPANRLDFYARAEKFLAKHLGGRAE